MGFSATSGVPFIDVCPYDPWLPISVMESVSSQRADQPIEMVVQPLWQNVGQANTGRNVVVDKLDKSRILEHIYKLSIARAIELTKEGKLLKKVGEEDDSKLEVPGPRSKGASPPGLDTSKLQATFHNAKGDIPVRQEWLDMVEDKLAEHPELLADFKQRTTYHDNEFNTSGVPYKGRKAHRRRTGGHRG